MILLQQVADFIGNQWLSILSILIGFIVSFTFYKRSNKEPKLVRKYNSYILLDGYRKNLPDEIKITINDLPLKRLTRTRIAIWNYGNVTQNGDQIYDKDPLSINLNDIVVVSPPKIVSQTKTGITSVDYNFEDNNILLSFDFLKPKDGFLVEFFHTGEEFIPEIRGTVMNLPNGIEDGGFLLKQSKNRKLSLLKEITFATLLIVFGLGLFSLVFIVAEVASIWLKLFYCVGLIIPPFAIADLRDKLKEKRNPEHINDAL
jgi:hypothetical protein